MNPAAQNNLASGGDNCGAWNNLNFGIPFGTTRVNPDVQHGWGVRNNSGVAGMSRWVTPRCATASMTALSTAGEDPIAPGLADPLHAHRVRRRGRHGLVQLEDGQVGRGEGMA